MGVQSLPRLSPAYLVSLMAPALAEEGASAEGMRKRLLPAQARMVSLCVKNEYVLQQWLDVANLMILKEEGNYKAHRLRITHLYEAGFSHCWQPNGGD